MRPGPAPGPGRAWRPASKLDLQPVQGLAQRLVARVAPGRFLPDATRLVLGAAGPQHLAQMCGDLGVGPPAVGLAQQPGGLGQIAQTELDPAQAVDDDRLARRQLERALDQLLGFAEAQVAIGQRIAQRVVGVVVVGLELDDPAQQGFHLFEAADPLGHHGLFVDQIGIAREAGGGGLQHGQRAGEVAVLAQQLGLGQQRGAGILVAGIRRWLQQLAALGQLALPCQQAGPAEVHLETAAIDLLQRRLGGLQVAALLGGLGQQQPHVAAAVSAGPDLAIGPGGWRVEALQGLVQRGLRGRNVLEVQLDGAQGQPGRGVVRRRLGQQPELPRGFGGALGLDQRPRIGLAQRMLAGVLLQPGADQCFSLGLHRQQIHGELHRIIVVGREGGELAGQRQRALVVAGVDGQPRLREQGGGFERPGLGLQHRAQRGQHRLGIGRALEQPGQRNDQAGALQLGRNAQQRRQWLGNLGRLVHQGQQLHNGLVGVRGAWPGLGPGARSHQGLVAGARLQRDVDDALEQLLVSGAARGVKQDLEGDTGLAVVQLQLADQQLIEQRRVHRRVDRRRGRRFGRSGILGMGLQGGQQGRGAKRASERQGHSNSRIRG
mmetsp:Transcript_26221/g.61905  ORF Transcript_26221/g.61905 Transcript_26221/m.61905 type:complete len:605 (+) Transcript_26221:4092-5906(+)